jgi:hypothetical protein
MFLLSNLCWVSSSTGNARYCWDPLMSMLWTQPWRHGVSGMGSSWLQACRRSEFTSQGKWRQQVTSLMVADMRWFRLLLYNMCMYTAISKVDQILFVTKIWQHFNLRRIKLIDMVAANLLNMIAMFCSFTGTKSDAIYASQSLSTCCVRSSLICDGSDHFLVSWRMQKLKICITLLPMLYRIHMTLN